MIATGQRGTSNLATEIARATPQTLLRRIVRGKSLRTVVGLCLSIALLAFLLTTIDLSVARAALEQASFVVIGPAVALYFAGLWLRCLRWGLLIRDPHASGGMHQRRLFPALVIGFTINNVLPARLGEVARAYLVRRWCGISYGRTLASLVIERILDGLILAAMLLISLPFVGDAPLYLLVLGLTVGGGFCIGLILAMSVASRSSLLTAWLERRTRQLSPGTARRLKTAVANFAAALRLIRGWRTVLGLLGLSVMAWLAELSLYYVLMLGFPGLSRVASLPLAMVVGSAANFATLVPSSPGYIGTFDGVLVRVLTDLSGQAAAYSAAYAIVVHLTLFVPVTVLGLFFFWRAQLSLVDVTGSSIAQSVARGADGLQEDDTRWLTAVNAV
jgi:glycosyltransferase 2 family protein